MEFKGTKGKWFVQSDWNSDCFRIKTNELGVQFISIGDDEGHDSIHVFSDFTKNNEEKINNLKANALLISKAPEMLYLLQDLLQDKGLNEVSMREVELLIKSATELNK